jgi:PiT family inorganic phosphate transporter
MLDVPLLLVAIVVIALVFDYTNGAHDAANAIAGVVSTRVLSPRAAVFMAATLDFVGALLGTSVALTIGSGIVNTEVVRGSRSLVLAALLGAIVWNLVTWYWGLPSSSSHALIGGLVGAGVAVGGFASLNAGTIVAKVLVPLVASPLVGFLGAYVLMVGLAWGTYRSRPARARRAFRGLQVATSAFMALSHGTNDAQKTMGLITLALVLFGQQATMDVPLWVKMACATAMLLGTATGGWKIIKTMGNKIFKLEPIHGFASAASSTATILAASALGAPISTTHVISSAVLGAGASRRLSAVRWGVARRMVAAWVMTLPAAALVSWLCFHALRLAGCGA